MGKGITVFPVQMGKGMNLSYTNEEKRSNLSYKNGKGITLSSLHKWRNRDKITQSFLYWEREVPAHSYLTKKKRNRGNKKVFPTQGRVGIAHTSLHKMNDIISHPHRKIGNNTIFPSLFNFPLCSALSKLFPPFQRKKETILQRSLNIPDTQAIPLSQALPLSQAIPLAISVTPLSPAFSEALRC